MINDAAKWGELILQTNSPQRSSHTFQNSLSSKREGVPGVYYRPILLVQVILTSQS